MINKILARAVSKGIRRKKDQSNINIQFHEDGFSITTIANTTSEGVRKSHSSTVRYVEADIPKELRRKLVAEALGDIQYREDLSSARKKARRPTERERSAFQKILDEKLARGEISQSVYDSASEY